MQLTLKEYAAAGRKLSHSEVVISPRMGSSLKRRLVIIGEIERKLILSRQDLRPERFTRLTMHSPCEL